MENQKLEVDELKAKMDALDLDEIMSRNERAKLYFERWGLATLATASAADVPPLALSIEKFQRKNIELKAKMAEAAEYVERAMSGLKGTHIKPELLKKALDILRGKE